MSAHEPRDAARPDTAPRAAPSVRPPATPSASNDMSAGQSAALPGEHRGGFRRALTEPVAVTAPSPAPDADVDVRWAPPPAAPLPRSAPWALTFAILGLAVSLVVGWGFLIGLLGTGLSIVALRRPWESRGVAVWALCLSLLSLVYSAGWLWWASTQGDLFASLPHFG